MLALLPAGTLPQSIISSSGAWPAGSDAAVGLMSKVCGTWCGDATPMTVRLRCASLSEVAGVAPVAICGSGGSRLISATRHWCLPRMAS
jgi:hypothetical protein